MKRMLLAFLVSPIGPVLVQVISFNLDGEYHPLAMFVVFSGLLYALQLVFVLPAYVAQHRRGQHQWWIYGLTGLLGTVIPMALLVLFGPQTKAGSINA